jgi:hypothetical protein
MGHVVRRANRGPPKRSACRSPGRAARSVRRNRGEPGRIAGVADWMVLVEAGDGLLEGGDAVDQLGEAVAGQAATLEPL